MFQSLTNALDNLNNTVNSLAQNAYNSTVGSIRNEVQKAFPPRKVTIPKVTISGNACAKTIRTQYITYLLVSNTLNLADDNGYDALAQNTLDKFPVYGAISAAANAAKLTYELQDELPSFPDNVDSYILSSTEKLEQFIDSKCFPPSNTTLNSEVLFGGSFEWLNKYFCFRIAKKLIARINPINDSPDVVYFGGNQVINVSMGTFSLSTDEENSYITLTSTMTINIFVDGARHFPGARINIDYPPDIYADSLVYTEDLTWYFSLEPLPAGMSNYDYFTLTSPYGNQLNNGIAKELYNFSGGAFDDVDIEPKTVYCAFPIINVTKDKVNFKNEQVFQLERLIDGGSLIPRLNNFFKLQFRWLDESTYNNAYIFQQRLFSAFGLSFFENDTKQYILSRKFSVLAQNTTDLTSYATNTITYYEDSNGVSYDDYYNPQPPDQFGAYGNIYGGYGSWSAPIPRQYQSKIQVRYDKGEPPPVDKNCCLEVKAMLRLLLKRVGELPANVPDNIAKVSPSTIRIQSLAELMLWQTKQLDATIGHYPIKIKVKDTDSTKAGDQSATITIPNLSEGIAELMGMSISTKRDTHATLLTSIKGMTQAGMATKLSQMSLDVGLANAEFLGYELKQKKGKLAMTFTPQGKDLSETLKEKEIDYLRYENTDKQDLMDHLRKLLEMAARWTAQNWRKISLDNPGASVIKNMVDGIGGLQDKEKTDRKQDKKDFDSFTEQAEKGFTDITGITDPLSPWGEDFKNRPRVREIGKDDVQEQ